MSGHKIWKDPRRVDQNDDWDIGIGKSRLVSGVVLKIANPSIVSPFLPQNAAVYFARSIPFFFLMQLMCLAGTSRIQAESDGNSIVQRKLRCNYFRKDRLCLLKAIAPDRT
jgi:hypothetical protein